MALTNLLVEKGVVDTKTIDKKYEQVRARTPMTGARIVARAWVDPQFKARLIKDPKKAVMEWDSNLLVPGSGETIDTWRVTRLEVLENTEKVKNLIVCTLCSCYPRGMIGEPPEWYTSDSYKEKVISNPRKLLVENGMKLHDDAQVRVYDSTADIRYMVLPLRPKGSKKMSEKELAKLVTRDNLIGVSEPLAPKHS
ncbi:MAG: nitrile hydratase subunit alpha [Thaumarchaeota archaeon]|nr:nitrile hydratase subunit alpha [Nitrososphaerota archaeon]